MKREIWVACVVLAACSVLLSSCSLFRETKPTPAPIIKTETPVFTPPAEPERPYCEVNYDFPLASVCNPKIYIYKNERRLYFLNDKTLIREYRIGLGPHPSGDKFMAGDGRTPEGEFYICVKNPTSQFYKSLGVSYPAPRHAEQGLLAGAIDREEYRRIVDATQAKSRPPWNTHLGGAIMIHGGGPYPDWTKGCIAINNSAIDELFATVPVGTPVYIMP